MKKPGDRWIDVPFGFAAFVWAWFMLIPAAIAGTWIASLMHLTATTTFFLVPLIALCAGIVAAVISRRLHGGDHE